MDLTRLALTHVCLLCVRLATRKKFTQLAKKFFSKSGRKKPSDVSQRIYNKVAAMGGEPTFALLDEDDCERENASSSHNVHNGNANVNVNVGLGNNANETPTYENANDSAASARRYQLDRY